MIIGIKEAGKPFEEKNMEGVKYRSEVFKKVFTNAYLESVTLYDNPTESSFLAMLVDEDGLLKDLPTNFFISKDNPIFPFQRIVGTVVFVRVKKLSSLYDEDYKVLDLTEGDRIRINFLLQENNQAVLRDKYIMYKNPLY
ncbi:MAG: hypothetical protein IK121_06690 [Lachnospiraceae bacterium]|nr:hypothetical protein [Lachnospiraceae bacterium]